MPLIGNVIADVERYLNLHPNPATVETDPIGLLHELYDVAKGYINGSQQSIVADLRGRVVELEARYKEAREKFHAQERRALELQAQLDGNALYRRIQGLEAEVKRYRELARSTEHEAVRLAEKLKGSRSTKPR